VSIKSAYHTWESLKGFSYTKCNSMRNVEKCFLQSYIGRTSCLTLIAGFIEEWVTGFGLVTVYKVVCRRMDIRPCRLVEEDVVFTEIASQWAASTGIFFVYCLDVYPKWLLLNRRLHFQCKIKTNGNGSWRDRSEKSYLTLWPLLVNLFISK